MVLALGVGIYARFKGLGTWPFGVDEYYISRSIDFLLASGLPEYPCGGFYQRGIIYQYLVGGLRLAGLTPEFAGRILPAVSSLAVLPAAWLLGRRLHSVAAGTLAVIVLALSLWEIEMARFARMYAPFQAVFAWYLLYFLRFTVDRDQRAALPMLLLSVLGVFTWEGGMLLAITNLLPVLLRHRDGRVERQGWLYLCIALPVSALILANLMDLRQASEVPSLADSVVAAREAAAATAPRHQLAIGGFASVWLLGGLVPLALTIATLPWIWSLRQRWLAAAGVLLALVAALASQLLLAGAVVLLLLLAQLLDWRELVSRKGRWFLATLAVSLLGWVAYGMTQGTRPGLKAALVHTLYQVAGFPDVIAEILRPWGSTLPLLTLCLALALAALTLHVVLVRKDRGDFAALLVMLLVLALAVGASGPPRHETRYTFFLYPLLVVLAMASEKLLGQARSAPVVTALVALLLFAASEDFRPGHILHIDSAAANFRDGLSSRLKTHLYPRSDYRAAARWLQENAGPQDLVVSGIPVIEQYYPRVGYSFLDEQDDRYDAYACRRGTIDRWADLPLVYPMDALDGLHAQGKRMFMVLYPDRLERVAAAAQEKGWNYRIEWPTPQHDIGVLAIEATTPISP
jgi:hypothetical protein